MYADRVPEKVSDRKEESRKMKTLIRKEGIQILRRKVPSIIIEPVKPEKTEHSSGFGLSGLSKDARLFF